MALGQLTLGGQGSDPAALVGFAAHEARVLQPCERSTQRCLADVELRESAPMLSGSFADHRPSMNCSSSTSIGPTCCIRWAMDRKLHGPADLAGGLAVTADEFHEVGDDWRLEGG
ncbi:hypothetical protein GCM10010492_60270 [Saccharothrix mutabilis subsp. mutabilis]|uniref:Uncharacterized protein n=1 Tax=Saccharothrix mutabilis subsp. mutabilis TaxID=66855 RepID=A0ABN0UIL8_9PSEU